MAAVLKTPYFLVDEDDLIHNLEILKRVQDETGCRILLAQKCFSMYSTYPLLAKYLAGTTASGLYEAKLGYRYMAQPFGKENHVYAAAYLPEDLPYLAGYCDHISFNSVNQWLTYKELCQEAGVSAGIRINPEISTQEGHEIYDPCAKYSRMGVRKEEFLSAYQRGLLEGLKGIHFHTLCEQNSDDLEQTLEVVEKNFGEVLKHMDWVNFGGGHHITRADYDLDRLISLIKHVKGCYQVEVYLEPGEAVALNAGYLEASVLDIVENDKQIAILDTSAACHMPDVLEMPYRPEVLGAGEEGEKKYSYLLAGPTCLSGDVIGGYSFDRPLKVGDRLTFLDMAIYSMVKTNTFNGMKLPAIYYRKGKEIKKIKSFDYEDFERRL